MQKRKRRKILLEDLNLQIQKKKESLLVGLFVLVVIAIVGVIGYNIIMMEFNPKYNVGTIYNDHIKSCVVKIKKLIADLWLQI